RALGGIELLRRYRQSLEPDPIEALRVVDQRSIAAAPHGIDDLAHRGHDARSVALRGALQNRAAIGGAERFPVDDAHGRESAQASIFSTGRTSTELAPTPFSCSRVSQKTFSRHTACTATRSSRPSSGMTVG